MAQVLDDWYRQIGEQVKGSTYLHADETGWRVNGQTHWLWCFTNDWNCYYMIDRCRGRPALQKFFSDEFEGVLITDFWAAYESVCAEDRQYCLVHLLRELEKVDETNTSAEWQAFAKKLRRLLGDGIRLRKRPDFAPGKFQSRVDRLNARVAQLAYQERVDGDARRLTKRLRKYAEHIFTFLDYRDVAYENNFAERQIRPAVILRKNSQSNRSARGAASQAVLMSVYRTLRLRGLNPTKTITGALKTYLTTGQLPPLPGAAGAGRCRGERVQSAPPASGSGPLFKFGVTLPFDRKWGRGKEVTVTTVPRVTTAQEKRACARSGQLVGYGT